MEKATRIRYFDAGKHSVTPIRSKTAHSDFLRTGRISRYEERWLPKERVYYSHDEVAAMTGRKLEAAADATHSRLNGFHQSIRFPRMVFPTCSTTGRISAIAMSRRRKPVSMPSATYSGRSISRISSPS